MEVTMNEDRCNKPHLHALLGAYELGILPEEEKRSMEEHILRCDACFEDLYETAPLRDAISSAATSERSRKKPWRIPVLAAAVLLLAFAVTSHFLQNESAVKRGQQTAGPGITLTGPKGTLREDRISFDWESPFDASSYTLVVFNEVGDVIWSRETTQNEIRVDVGQEERFEPNQRYYWKVEARNKNGRLLSTSNVSSFLIEAD